MRLNHKITKPVEGLAYHQAQAGEPYWCPEFVKEVSNKLGWCVLYVEQHPDGEIIVTFGDGSGIDGAGRIFEMHLDVVRAMNQNIGRATRPRSVFDLL